MRITVLAGSGGSSNILLNWLSDNGFTDVEAIIEENISRRQIIRNRIRRIGLFRVAGQIAFMMFVNPLLRRISATRRQEILENFGLRVDSPKKTAIIRVNNINDSEVSECLRSRCPDVILVNGTRIIRRRILECVKCPFINTHVGITPKYRGVHGGYWALWNSDFEDFGVTLHLVDPGVDTGAVLAQGRVKPTKEDNFASYPLLQQAISFGLLAGILHDLENGSIFPISCGNTAESRQWYHPTIWQYISGKTRGIK